MSTFADMLDPADRERLEYLADPEGRDLAAAARQAAAESTGPGRVAWSIVAMVLDLGDGTAETARGLIDAIANDGQIRTTARACLDALCGDGDTTAETP